jgi:hypothetical protein
MQSLYKYKTHLKINYSTLLFPAFFLLLGLGSCKKYLDKQSDQTLSVPSTLGDCQLLLNNMITFNMKTSGMGELLSDNFTVASYNTWSTYFNAETKAAYIFEPQVNSPVSTWLHYESVFHANVVLETLEGITPANAVEQTTWNNLRGAALFFRGYAFYQLSQLFAPAYDAATAGQDLGIPLRLKSDVSEESVRANVQSTYDRIIADLTEATELLPTTAEHITQPNKAAAYGMLSRTYLMMRNYPSALQNATKSLTEKNTLLDFNLITSFVKYNNPEVLCHIGGGGELLNAIYGRVAPSFYNSYAANDRRPALFFKSSPGGTYSIAGSYTGEYAVLLGGAAVDEMYLTRAECHARAGNKDLALTDLNTLLRKRYNASFVDVTAATPEAALDIILTERRKELVYRNIRWSDIKRLNKEGRNIVLTHGFPDNAATYSLQPNELRYTLLIPKDVMDKSNITQTPR